MASIQKYATKHGTRWRVQYRDPAGRPRTKQGFRRKAEAQAWAAQNAVDARAGVWTNPTLGRTTVEALWDGWLSSQHHLAESSRLALDAAWRTHVMPAWGACQVSAVTPADVQEWVNELAARRSPTIVHRSFGVLRGLLQDAVRDRMVAVNPCEGVRLPAKRGKKLYVLSREQLDALTNATGRFPSLIAFMGYTGARWGETVALTVGDVDLERGRASITKSASTIGGKVVVGRTKTGRARTIGIPRQVCVMLEADAKDKLPSALVWPNSAGGYLTTPSRRSWFHAAVDRCRKADPDFPDISPHDLRHTAASLLIAAGAPVTLVARQLGHASVKLTLDTYAHLFDDQLSDVVEMSWKADKNLHLSG